MEHIKEVVNTSLKHVVGISCWDIWRCYLESTAYTSSKRFDEMISRRYDNVLKTSKKRFFVCWEDIKLYTELGQQYI